MCCAVSEVFRIQIAKAKWRQDIVQQDRNNDVERPGQLGFFQHPMGLYGLLGPQNNRSLRLPEDCLDFLGKPLTRQQIDIPPDGIALAGYSLCNGACLLALLALVTDENICQESPRPKSNQP